MTHPEDRNGVVVAYRQIFSRRARRKRTGLSTADGVATSNAKILAVEGEASRSDEITLPRALVEVLAVLSLPPSTFIAPSVNPLRSQHDRTGEVSNVSFAAFAFSKQVQPRS